MSPEAFMLAGLILAAAVLYSSVGHAGASGYLAAMALFGLAPETMKPAALVLNVLVATIGSIRFARAGCFDWRLFWPFALVAIPMAYLGGATTLPGHIYKQIVGAVLVVAAVNLLLKKDKPAPAGSSEDRSGTQTESADQPHRAYPPIWLSMIVGGVLGLLAGLTGTGGGIFLSPFLLIVGWADARRTAGISVVFVLVNSIAGLSGQLTATARPAARNLGVGSRCGHRRPDRIKPRR